MKHEFGEVRSFDRRTAEQTRTIPFVFSTSDRDRHGTILNQDGWKLDNFNRNGIALYCHDAGDSDPDRIIGSAKAWTENGRLLGTITFEPESVNPLAEKIFQKCLLKTLKAVSVGFLEIGKGQYRDGTYYYEGQELLEISVVSIPSNAQALARKPVFHSEDQRRRWMRVQYLKLKQ